MGVLPWQLDRALKIQQRLADEAHATNAQRHYIHNELSLLYAALDDPERAYPFQLVAVGSPTDSNCSP